MESLNQRCVSRGYYDVPPQGLWPVEDLLMKRIQIHFSTLSDRKQFQDLLWRKADQ